MDTASAADNLWRVRNFHNWGRAGDGTQAHSIYESNQIFSPDPANAEDSPRLHMTVSTGLPNFQVHAYIYYWTSTASWRIKASLTNSPAELPRYSANDGAGSGQMSPISGPTRNLGSDFDAPNDDGVGVDDSTNIVSGVRYFDPAAWANVELIPGILYQQFAVDVQEADRRLMEGYLGIAQTDSNGYFSVFIDDDPTFTEFPNFNSVNGNLSQDIQNVRTWFDGVGFTAVPEPASLALLGLGALALIARNPA